MIWCTLLVSRMEAHLYVTISCYKIFVPHLCVSENIRTNVDGIVRIAALWKIFHLVPLIRM